MPCLSRTGARVKYHNEWTELGKTRGTVPPPLGPSLVLPVADMSPREEPGFLTHASHSCVSRSSTKLWPRNLMQNIVHWFLGFLLGSGLDVWLVDVCYGFGAQLLDLLYTSVQDLPRAPTVRPVCTHCVRLGGRDKRKGGPRF